MRKALPFLVILFFFLQACTPAETTAESDTATTSFTPTANSLSEQVLVTPTTPPTPTLTPAPTETPVPTLTSTPTPEPTPTATALPLGIRPIDRENAGQLAELAVLGKGSLLGYDWIAEGRVLLVLTPLGLYHLEPESLEQIQFHPGVLEYYRLPGDERLLLRYPEGVMSVVQAEDGMDLFRLTYEIKIPWNYESWLARLPFEIRDLQRERLRSEFFSIRSVAVSPDQKILAVAHGDDHIRLWSLEDGTLVQDLVHALVTDVEQMAFSTDAAKLVVVERGSDMAVWNVPQAKLLWHRKEVGHINGQPFSPDEKLLAVEISSFISADSWVVLLSAEYGDELGKITGARVSSDPFSADSRHLATYWYQRVRIFLTTNLAYIQKIETGLDIANLSYAPDGSYLLVNGGEKAYRSPDYTPDEAAPFQPTPVPVYVDPTVGLRSQGFYSGLEGVLPLADGRLRAWGSQEMQAFYWFDLPAGDLQSLELPTDLAKNIEVSHFAADGSAVFYCTPARLFILPLVNPQPRDLGRCSNRAILAYSPDTGILARGQGTTLDLIEVASGEILHNLLGHNKQISGLAFSEDGSLLASGSADIGSRGYGEVAMWTTEPAHNLAMDRLQPWGVYELAYSPDNRWLAFYNNGNLRIWSVTERRLYAYFDSSAIRFTFSPDSQLLAAGDRDGKVHLYEVPSGRELAVYDAALGPVIGLRFSQDGGTLVVSGMDGLIRLWGVK